ncbi:MAG: hypothetical protein JW925_14165, partial [Syntrophaceae bacterium]|nr:hypothetical protein [Syntrophaceae bacterium]
IEDRPVDQEIPLSKVERNDEMIKGINVGARVIGNRNLLAAAILSKPSSYYTIQMMGANDATYLINVAKKYGIESEAAIFKKKNGTTDWYVLVYRFFSDKLQAIEAVETLAAELKTNRPWVRKLEDIRNEMTGLEMATATAQLIP